MWHGQSGKARGSEAGVPQIPGFVQWVPYPYAARRLAQEEDRAILCPLAILPTLCAGEPNLWAVSSVNTISNPVPDWRDQFPLLAQMPSKPR